MEYLHPATHTSPFPSVTHLPLSKTQLGKGVTKGSELFPCFGIFAGSAAWPNGQVEFQLPAEAVHPGPLAIGQARLAAAANARQLRLLGPNDARRPTNVAAVPPDSWPRRRSPAAGPAAGHCAQAIAQNYSKDNRPLAPRFSPARGWLRCTWIPSGGGRRLESRDS